MALPFGTKVYLEDKTLKKIEDLNFGDKVLSIKIEDEECKNHSNIYHKYLKKDKVSNNKYIEKNLIKLSSTYVYSIFKHKYYTNFISLNDKIISSVTPFLISKTPKNPLLFYIKDSRDIIFQIKNNKDEQYFIQNLQTDFFEKNINDQDNNIFLQNKIENIILNIEAQPAVDVVLLDNHFLITENFICFGSIVEDIPLS